MNHVHDVYDVREALIPDERALYYFFVSKGRKNILKVIQYHCVRQFNNKPLFNLGFGDYNHETKTLSDKTVSGNNDHYRVFNTVLATIPKLFDVHENAAVVVKGSDSTFSFLENCRKECIRKCDNDICKKAHRRIGVYRHFVNKHFELLNQQFAFYGIEGLEENSPSEPYKVGKNYKEVIIEKRLN